MEMSPEEQQAHCGDELDMLIERQQTKIKGMHNVPLNACNDTRATLSSVSGQVLAIVLSFVYVKG